MSRQFAALKLGSIELFCLAAESASFAAAAIAAGLTPAAVSRSVSRLEARLAVRLFVRTTRRIRLTESGRQYYEQCREALQQIVAAEHNVADGQRKPAGTLRISVPTAYGHYRLLPLLPAFRASYPDVKLDIHLSNRSVDLTDEKFDLAIRGRVQPDSSLITRKLEDAELMVVATPDYLQRTGAPQTLEQLRDHECIQFVLPRDGKRIDWLFRQNGKDVEISTDGGYCCSDDVLGIVTLARSGAGIVQTYRFNVADDLRNGVLVEILQRYGGRSRSFSLIYPHRNHVATRVRMFIEFLFDTLKNRIANETSPDSRRRASRRVSANKNSR